VISLRSVDPVEKALGEYLALRAEGRAGA